MVDAPILKQLLKRQPVYHNYDRSGLHCRCLKAVEEVSYDFIPQPVVSSKARVWIVCLLLFDVSL